MAKKVSSILLALVLLCFALSCEGPRVIPKGKMAKIYAEMALADKWLQTNQQYITQATRSIYYEAVFQRYGYTVEEYRYSVDYYMQNPQEYSRIIEKSMDIVRKFQLKQRKLRGDDISQDSLQLEITQMPGRR